MTIENRVQPLKLEDPDTGGGSMDMFPTALNKNEDYIDCHGIVFQDTISNDETTIIGREGNDMIFIDGNNQIKSTLTDLLSGTVSNNKCYLIFKEDGGVCYTTNGDIIEKGSD